MGVGAQILLSVAPRAAEGAQTMVLPDSSNPTLPLTVSLPRGECLVLKIRSFTYGLVPFWTTRLFFCTQGGTPCLALRGISPPSLCQWGVGLPQLPCLCPSCHFAFLLCDPPVSQCIGGAHFGLYFPGWNALCRWRFGVSVREGGFRLSLLCHLPRIPGNFYIFRKVANTIQSSNISFTQLPWMLSYITKDICQNQN